MKFLNQADTGQDVFILERSETELKVANAKEYILEGIAAIFGEENNNGRVYEEAEYFPHLEYLKEKINAKRLVGELDHPEKFDVSLKHISHIIESLDYDKATRQLKIKVRLLDTPGGRIAKALVDAGVPISISSRAAGSVMENKKVKIKKIFTYDLVADPGFEKAQLERVYESANFEDSVSKTLLKSSVLEHLDCLEGDNVPSNMKIYTINESDKVSFQRALDEEKPKPGEMSDTKKFVTIDEMNDYSALIKKNIETEVDVLKNLITDTKNSVATAPIDENASKSNRLLESRLVKLEGYVKYIAENLDKNIQYSEYLAENLDKGIEYTKYLAENLDKNISFADYLAENLEKNISYSEYLAENLDRNITYSEYLAENLDRNITYSEYLAENLDRNITYSEYLAENLDRNITYSEYLAENLDRNITYSEYLAENLNTNINYAEYLAENLDKGIGYAEYIAEKLERNIAYSEYIAESVNTTETESIAESKKIVEIKKTDYSNLSESINALLTSANNQKAASKLYETDYKFFKFLGEEKREEFMSLNEAKKEKVATTLKDGVYFNEADITTKWDAALVEQAEQENAPLFMQLMPDNVKALWENLSVEEQERNIAASKLRKLETEYQIKNFWRSRGFVAGKTVGLVKLNENQTTTAIKTKPNLSGISNDYMAGVAEAVGKRFKK